MNDFEHLKDKYLTNKDKVVCIACGKRHFPDEQTFITIYGNICIGLDVGIVGNNFKDDRFLSGLSFICYNSTCINKAFGLTNIATFREV